MISTVQSRNTKIENGLRGGEGATALTALFEEHIPHMRLCSVIELEPGSSIGEHIHQNDCEVYYILNGEATVLDSDLGKEIVLRPGEAHLCRDGQAHYLKNSGNERLSLLAVIPTIAE